VNRLRLRASAVTAGLAACGLTAAVALTGCGAGQISQTANQQAAVNGVNVTVGDLSLRNIHLRAPQTADYVRPGTRVELIFTVANNSPDQPDRLTSVRSDVGNVSISGDPTVPAGGSLVVGQPDGQIAALESVDAAEPGSADVSLSQPISNGLTYDFTFSFQRNGDATVAVPISAGEAPRQDDSGGGDQSGGH
jgi:hypothetical protein